MEVSPAEEPVKQVAMEVPSQSGAQLESVPANQDQDTVQAISSSNVDAQTKEPKDIKTPDPESGPVHTHGLIQKNESSKTDISEAKELQEGQEIYIQTEGLTVQLAEPGTEQIVIVNGPDGTTMHIQNPEGVPLEAVQALLGIESSDRTRDSQ